jgi:hypothetical protein
MGLTISFIPIIDFSISQDKLELAKRIQVTSCLEHDLDQLNKLLKIKKYVILALLSH